MIFKATFVQKFVYAKKRTVQQFEKHARGKRGKYVGKVTVQQFEKHARGKRGKYVGKVGERTLPKEGGESMSQRGEEQGNVHLMSMRVGRGSKWFFIF